MDLEQNKETARAYLDLAFNARRPMEAFDRYVGPSYVQHNPHAPDGAEASRKFLGAFVERFPQLRLDIRRVIAEGDLVVTHGLMKLTDAERGTAIVDIIRFADGKIVEHWDVAQPVPDDPANQNTMF
ncbi:nuclear transport factor 2 family protein [Fodinicola feengrottensis]|uniref:Nuclear transport factor 2 family protein n=1 Tax=Fodinicola feengrottensis TaxID=435914 RepID=A0ABP4RK68_9ACTN|nr:nuclear transport factor 2 family protein [Fodinicola feengrottensis]